MGTFTNSGGMRVSAKEWIKLKPRSIGWSRLAYDSLVALINRPTKPDPKLQKLMTQPSVLEKSKEDKANDS